MARISLVEERKALQGSIEETGAGAGADMVHAAVKPPLAYRLRDLHDTLGLGLGLEPGLLKTLEISARLGLRIKLGLGLG